MQRGATGTYIATAVASETVRSFVPAPLPQTPAIKLSGAHQRLLALFQQDAVRVSTLGRSAANALHLFDALRRRPVATIGMLAQQTGVSFATAARHVEALVHLGILHELTHKSRERVFAYQRYLDILNEGAQA